ncbi:MAG: NCS1 family nucleobase:cation symporter-1 [Actinomycetes bacterium]
MSTEAERRAHGLVVGPSHRLYNDDLAPARERSWGTYSLFAMWMSDVHSIGGYAFAAGLFFLGLVGWQVFAALVLGITVVFFLMNLTGFAGQRTGVPFPVIARISFGVFGANLAALIRAVIAIAWYGIQTWLASQAVLVLAVSASPGLAAYTDGGFLGLSPLGWVAFAVLWVLQLFVIRRGMETVRRFQDFAGPAIWVVMFVLGVWVVVEAGSDFSLTLTTESLSGGAALQAFLAATALTITYFSTLLLNFCDFSRFAPNRRTVIRGNFWGLPVNFLAFAVVTVAVTAGSIAVFGEAITDPVEIVERIDNIWVTVVGAITFIVATIGINVVANFVSASYDLANVAPKHLNFRRGGVLSAVIAVLIVPWNLYSSPVAINYFLGGLGALLGPLFGVIFVDYFLVRRQQVSIEELYLDDPRSRYYYRRGWNPRALAAFGPAALVALVVALVPALSAWAPFSWFVGVAIAGAIYAKIAPREVRQPELAAADSAGGADR